ncbi:MAG: phosphodiester glycosidase family protein [Ruminococcaceae bacterium]|nr:phosphodiester glycosidase family protein [Oscillospiraceae bacterium]
MQNNSYQGGIPSYEQGMQDMSGGFAAADGTEQYRNPDPGVYPAQNMPRSAPDGGYQRQAIPVRRAPARRGPAMTNGYLFSFGNEQDNSMEEREQLELIAQRVRMTMQAQQAAQAQAQATAQAQQTAAQPAVQQAPQYLPVQQPIQQPAQPVQQYQQYCQTAQNQQAQTASRTVQQVKTASDGAARKHAGSGTASAKKTKASARLLPRAKRIRDSIMLAGMMIIFSFSAVFMLNSGAKQNNAPTEQKSYFEDLNAEILAFKSDSVSSIFDIPKGYILPWGEQPAPVPDPEGFGETTNENGVRVLTYKDPTISMSYWTERIYDSSVHFAEIIVAHPTQLRTAYAGGEFGSSDRYMPQEIARQVNAVVAVNADYCGYRTGGIIIRQNTMYRDTARGWDMLLIDSAGDFHIMEDKDVYPSGIMDEHDIVNTLVFGPSLVVDGEVKILNIQSGCGPTWGEVKPSPRTAVGQIGKMHYLFCCVEGRSDTSRGVLLSELGRIMLDKGCTQAYNLDGGQSTTMVINGKAMNSPLWGSQRVVTDIIYCATAIPDKESEAANE